MSDFEFKPIHKFFKITISSIKYERNTNSDINSLHVYNNTPNHQSKKKNNQKVTHLSTLLSF